MILCTTRITSLQKCSVSHQVSLFCADGVKHTVTKTNESLAIWIKKALWKVRSGSLADATTHTKSARLRTDGIPLMDGESRSTGLLTQRVRRQLYFPKTLSVRTCYHCRTNVCADPDICIRLCALLWNRKGPFFQASFSRLPCFLSTVAGSHHHHCSLLPQFFS